VELAPDSPSAKEIQGLWRYIGERLRRLKSTGPILIDTPRPDEKETSDVGEILDLLGFNDEAIAAESENIEEVVPAKNEQAGFDRRPSFGRRGVVHAVGA
jgi:hypothetical protein